MEGGGQNTSGRGLVTGCLSAALVSGLLRGRLMFATDRKTHPPRIAQAHQSPPLCGGSVRLAAPASLSRAPRPPAAAGWSAPAPWGRGGGRGGGGGGEGRGRPRRLRALGNAKRAAHAWWWRGMIDGVLPQAPWMTCHPPNHPITHPPNQSTTQTCTRTSTNTRTHALRAHVHLGSPGSGCGTCRWPRPRTAARRPRPPGTRARPPPRRRCPACPGAA